jgi:putative ATP-dependent endonuclease of OLD family
MLLSPAPGRVASEHDYYRGCVEAGFKIELLVGQLDEAVLSAWPVPPLWTWFAGNKRVQADPDPAGEGVLCLRVKGNDDLEIQHVVIDPSEGEIPLSPSKRQAFGLSKISSAGTAYRELRMSRGSLLARNIQPEQLRGLVTEAVQATRDQFQVSEDIEARLQEISAAFKGIAPGAGALNLAMLSPPGQNLLGMIGLFADNARASVPLASAGLGTQQLALFTLARLLIHGSPLFVIDEIEGGLEPFRQRDLIARVRKTIGKAGQAFVTTHSPAAVGEMAVDELYRVSQGRAGCEVAALSMGLERMRSEDPESLLCRIPLVLEGQTEIGVLRPLLEKKAGEQGTTLGALGIRLVDGGGQPKVFGITDALTKAQQRFGAFLDDEREHKGKRASLAATEGVAFGTYGGARCLEEALSKQLAIEDLDQLITLKDTSERDYSDARYQQINGRLGPQGRRTMVELAAEHGEERCREEFGAAANSGSWFKSPQTSRALGEYLRDHHADSQVVRDAEGLWSSMIDLISGEVTFEGVGDADDGA